MHKRNDTRKIRYESFLDVGIDSTGCLTMEGNGDLFETKYESVIEDKFHRSGYDDIRNYYNEINITNAQK